jgi:type IV secretory pathway VirB10-like protein
VVAVLAFAVLSATIWSLQAQRGSVWQAPTELHNVDRISRAEGLDQLPPDYSKMRAAPAANAPPVLGSPLPGDLGAPILRAERQGAIDPLSPVSPAVGPHADPYADAARVERINRQREAEDAAKAPLFFKASVRRNETPTERAPLTATPGPIANPDSITVGGNASTAATSSNSQNMQERKEGFINRSADTTTRSSHVLQLPISPYQLMAGTVIPAALVTGINSDLPGQVIATVTEQVFDTATGRHLLIPQGSRLFGQYDSQVAFGQRRVLLVWTRLLLPDASSITLDRLPGVDPSGSAGLEDDVDWHWKQLLAGAALSTLIGVGAQLAAPDRSIGQNQVVVATRGSLQDTINQVGQELTRRNLNVQPTLTIRPGYPVQVIVNKDLVLRPYQPLFFERSSQ